MRDPIGMTHPLYRAWNRVRLALIDGQVTPARLALASILRALRARGEADLAEYARAYAAYLGWPVSDAYLDNRLA